MKEVENSPSPSMVTERAIIEETLFYARDIDLCSH